MENKELQAAMMQQQMAQIEQHVSSLSEQISELNLLFDNLGSLSENKEEKQAFMPLSGGIYVEGSLKPIEKLLVNVGSGVMVKKNLPDTQEIIKKQISQLEEARDRLSKELEKASLQGLKA